MNFEQLEIELHAKVKPQAARWQELQDQMAALRQKIADTESYCERVQRHLEELEGEAGKALLGGQNEYTKYQTSLKNRRREVEDKQEEIRALNGALEQTQKDFAVANQKLNDALLICDREHVPAVQAEVTALIEQILALYDGWQDSRIRAHGKYGVSFHAGELEVNPQLRHERISQNYPGLIVALTFQQRAERLKAQKKE